jgi:hypothetical protein
MLTVEILLRRAGDAAVTALDGPLADEAARARSRLDGAQVRLAPSLVLDRRAAIDAGEDLTDFDAMRELGGLPPAHTRVPVDSYDHALEIRLSEPVDEAAVLAALDGLAERLGPAVDRGSSCVAAGRADTIIEGGGPVRLFYCFRRLGSLSHDEFSRYWRHRLVEHTTKTPAKTGYQQLHVDLALSSTIAEAAGVAVDDFDGVALEWYPDVEGLMTAVRWASEPDAAIIRSESNINDFSTATAMVAYVPDVDRSPGA